MTATDYQLLACFGVEPERRDASELWCHDDALYQVQIDGFLVSFAVAPIYPDVRIVVQFGGRRIFEFASMAVEDVRVIDEPGIDAVEVHLTARSTLRLQLRPAFAITHQFTNRD